MLFAGTLGTSRASLSQGVPLLIVSCVALIGMYGVVFVSCRLIFSVSTGTSALAALTASAPAVPFMGPAILGHFFGQTSAILIAIASLVINLTVVPATILFLSLEPVSGSGQRKGQAAQGQGYAVPRRTALSAIAAKLWETVREPLVWAPIVAFAVVLSDVHRSSAADRPAFVAGTRDRRCQPVCGWGCARFQ